MRLHAAHTESSRWPCHGPAIRDTRGEGASRVTESAHANTPCEAEVVEGAALAGSSDRLVTRGCRAARRSRPAVTSTPATLRGGS
jgi:hypothetical protein